MAGSESAILIFAYHRRLHRGNRARAEKIVTERNKRLAALVAILVGTSCNVYDAALTSAGMDPELSAGIGGKLATSGASGMAMGVAGEAASGGFGDATGGSRQSASGGAGSGAPGSVAGKTGMGGAPGSAGSGGGTAGAGRAGELGSAGTSGSTGAGHGGAVSEGGATAPGGATSHAGTAGMLNNGGTGGGSAGTAGTPSNGGTAGQGGAVSGGSGGALSSAGAGGALSSAGTGGAQDSAQGCAKLSVPLDDAADRVHFVISLTSPLDLSKGTVSVRFYVQSGSGGSIFSFVQDAARFHFFAVQGAARPKLSTFSGWSTLTWDVGATDPGSSNIDKTTIKRIGVEINAAPDAVWSNPTVVYLDSITVVQPSLTTSFTFDTSSSVSTSTSNTSDVSGQVLWLNSLTSDTTATGVSLGWQATCP